MSLAIIKLPISQNSEIISMLQCIILLLFATVVNSRFLACNPVRWCVGSSAEYEKCVYMLLAFREEGTFTFLECVIGKDKYDCMQKINANEADLITLDGADAYVAGRYHNMVPIMQEKYDTDPKKIPFLYHSTIVINKGANIYSMKDLKGKKSCHTGVDRTVGWMMPISTLRAKGLIDNTNCLNPLQSVADFFNQSCAYGAKDPRYNPLGAAIDLQSLCDLCDDKEKCDENDKYSGYKGAFNCLKDGVGDVAFVKEEVILNNMNLTDDFSLLCPNGKHATFKKYNTCNWGFRPSQAIMTRRNRTKFEKFIIISMLNLAQTKFASSSKSKFKIFESEKEYKHKNLLFRDSTLSLVAVENESYRQYLGDAYLRIMENLHPCPYLKRARWCVVSYSEKNKCLRMRDAFMSRRLRPEIDCVMAPNFAMCMQMINRNQADLVALDGGDIYMAGKVYGLIPIAYEYYGDDDATYWSVAVTKKGSNVRLNSLKGTKSCHPGISTIAGWNVPIGYLVESRQFIPECDIVQAIGHFFSQSCVPGVLSSTFNPKNTNPANLCALCAGTNSSFCRRDSSEPYYSFAGAFRCLSEGKGDVAFIKHTTPLLYTNGQSIDNWAKNLSSNDFELLCIDGTRKPVTEYRTCNLAKIPSHSIMTSKNHSDSEIDLYLTLLLQAQEYYKNDTNSYFQMFASIERPDLIFKDSTIELRVIPKEKRSYDKWLGNEYITNLLASNIRLCLP